MKVAFASKDGVHINEHFGWAKQFVLYEVDENCTTFLKTITCDGEIESEKEKLSAKIEAIREADIMYCSQIGPTASKMVLAGKIHPVRACEEETVEEAMHKLQQLITSQTPMWLLRVMHKGE
jgi:nitrogen fixation protein NifX